MMGRRFRAQTHCSRCGGRGVAAAPGCECRGCGGRGVLQKKQKVTVVVPAGCQDGRCDQNSASPKKYSPKIAFNMGTLYRGFLPKPGG
jgi:DnaJ-class molecular chaperone